MFHSEKSGRYHIMNNDIKQGEDDHLQLHKSVLNDTTNISRMKDDYPIQLFQIKNALKDFKKKNNSFGMYLFVYSLIIELFRNPFMKIEFRLFLSKMALLLLLSFYRDTQKLPTNTALRKNARLKKEFVFFNDRIGIIKRISTTIALSTILRKNKTSFCLGLERISSYPEEEYFGNYRTHYNGFYTAINSFRYTVRSSLALDFQNDLNIEFPISKSENFAGAHLNYENSKGEYFDKLSIFDQIQSDHQIYEIVNDVYKTGTGEKTKLGRLTYNFIHRIVQKSHYCCIIS